MVINKNDKAKGWQKAGINRDIPLWTKKSGEILQFIDFLEQDENKMRTNVHVKYFFILYLGSNIIFF